MKLSVQSRGGLVELEGGVQVEEVGRDVLWEEVRDGVKLEN